jgi:hypothetical protein
MSVPTSGLFHSNRPPSRQGLWPSANWTSFGLLPFETAVACFSDMFALVMMQMSVRVPGSEMTECHAGRVQRSRTDEARLVWDIRRESLA